MLKVRIREEYTQKQQEDAARLKKKREEQKQASLKALQKDEDDDAVLEPQTESTEDTASNAIDAKEDDDDDDVLAPRLRASSREEKKESADTKQAEEEDEPRLPKTEEIHVNDIEKSMADFQLVMKWSQYHLKRLNGITADTANHANQMWTYLRAVYLMNRMQLIKFEVPESIFTDQRTPALVWFTTMIQLLLVSRYLELEKPEISKWSLHKQPDLLERIQCVDDGPVLQYSLHQCMMMLTLLMEDLSKYGPCPNSFTLFELLELRLSILMCFLWTEKELDDPNYANTVSSEKKTAVLNSTFLSAAERLVFYLALTFTVHSELNAKPLAPEEAKSLDIPVQGLDRWIRAFTDRILKTGATPLRPSFREGLLERALLPHERELVKLTKVPSEQRHLEMEAMQVLSLNRFGILTSVLVESSDHWRNLLSHHADSTRSGFTEALLQFIEYFFSQKMSAGGRKYSFLQNNYVRQTFFHDAARLFWFSSSEVTQTVDWKKQVTYPVIFDFRPRPIVYLHSMGLARECPDHRVALVLWCDWLMRSKKGVLHNGVDLSPWINELNTPAMELADVKTKQTMLPICDLPAEITAQLKEEYQRITADKLAHQIEVDEKARKRLEEDRKKLEAQRAKKLAEVRAKEKEDERKYLQHQQKLEQKRLAAIAKRVLERKQQSEQQGIKRVQKMIHPERQVIEKQRQATHFSAMPDDAMMADAEADDYFNR